MAAAFAAFATGAALLIGGSGLHGTSAVPLQLLFLTAGGLAAYGAGVAGGVAAVVMTAFLFLRVARIPVSECDDALAEVVLTTLIGLLVRRHLLRSSRSERKLLALFRSMRDVTTVMNAEGCYLEVIPTRVVSRYVQQGRTAHELLPAETADFVVKTIGEALARQETVYGDYKLVSEDETIWLSATVSPLSTKTVLWVARDITARKIAEERLRQTAIELEQRVEQRTSDLQQTIDALREESNLRSAAEEAVLRSESRYRNIVNQARDIIFTLDLQGRITSLNSAFTNVLGYPVDDWIGRTFFELVVPEERAMMMARFEAARSKPLLEIFRATLTGASGRRVIIEASSAHQTENHRVIGFLGFGRDVTERETEALELRRSQAQLAEAQRLARLGSWERDAETGRVSWSEEMHAILETDPGMEVQPDTFAKLVVAEDRERFDELGRRLLSSPAEEADVTVQLPSGVRKHLKLSAHATRSADGKLRVAGVVQDLTERKQAEQLLRESEERFRLLARATNDAVWDWDYLANYVWRGEAYQTQFGYGPETLEHAMSAWHEVIHPDDRERVMTSFDTAIESGQLSWSEEYRYRRADGSYAHVLDRGYIVRDTSHRVIRVLGAMMDLTEQKQLEEQVAQSRRLSSLGRVAASIAHEFNNVLMGIQPNVEVIQRKAPAEMSKVVESITSSVRRGKRITEEILRFTRPTDPQLQSVGMREFFDAWQEEVRSLLGSSVILDLRLPLDEIHVSADPLLIAQVFTNLAVNARDAMEARGGGILTIEAEAATSFSTFRFGVVRSPDRYAHFRVKDTGTGISSDRLHHLFEPLFTTKRGGTGLGLAISHQIVTRHGGHIFVESEVGLGTTFHIFLPLALLPAVAGSPPVPKARYEPLGRILLVEDEPAVSAGISMLLEVEGSVVEVVDRGEEAVAAVERFDPDLVILDIGLPDIDGVEVYRRLDERWPELPVIFSSGHAHAANLDRFIEKPHIGLLMKPYDFATLTDTISRLQQRLEEIA